MTNLTSPSVRTGLKAASITALCLAFTACSSISDKIVEEGAERIIESENGGDVELDFDSDDGSFSVETEDGSFSVDENGDFVVTDQDGSVFTGSASDDGLTVTDESGDQVIDIDTDGDNGEITIQGDDGADVFRSFTDIPDEWPADIPRPDGLEIESGSFISGDGEILMTVFGAPSGSAVDYVDDYAAGLTAAGLTETGNFSSNADGAESAQYDFESADWIVNISGFTEGDTDTVAITLISSGA